MSNDLPFPDLRVVPIEQCALHEETDARRVARLTARLEGDRLLRNPPILGRHAGLEALIVLDGATRVTALTNLGARHILAQVVDYDDDSIQLHTWRHLLTGASLSALAAALADEPLLTTRPCTLPEAEAALSRRETLAYLADYTGRCLTLGDGVDMVTQAAALRRLFALYAARAAVSRVPPAEWRARLQEHGPHIAVVFPIHTKDDLVALVQGGTVLPAGITRHIIPGRALRVNAPLELMLDGRTLAEKQAWLDAWLRERRDSHSVRFYAEPTFLFDE